MFLPFISSAIFAFVLNNWWRTATALQTSPKETSTHLALSALSSLPVTTPITEESLRSAVQNIVGQDVDLPEEFDNAIGEMYVTCFVDHQFFENY